MKVHSLRPCPCRGDSRGNMPGRPCRRRMPAALTPLQPPSQGLRIDPGPGVQTKGPEAFWGPMRDGVIALSQGQVIHDPFRRSPSESECQLCEQPN